MADLVEILTEIKNQCQVEPNTTSQDFLYVLSKNTSRNLDYFSLSQQEKINLLSEIFAKNIHRLDIRTLSKINFLSSIMKQVKSPANLDDLQEIYYESSTKGTNSEFMQECIKKIDKKINISVNIAYKHFNIELIQNTPIVFLDYINFQFLPRDDLYLKYSEGKLILSQQVSTNDSSFYYYAQDEVKLEPDMKLMVEKFYINIRGIKNEKITFRIFKLPDFQNFELNSSGNLITDRIKIGSKFQGIINSLIFEKRGDYFYMKHKDNTKKIFIQIYRYPENSPFQKNSISLSENQKLDLCATNVNTSLDFSIIFNLII